MDESAIYLKILQENDIILDESIFIDIDRVEPPKQFHFELFSENGDVNKKPSKISSFYVSHTVCFLGLHVRYPSCKRQTPKPTS